MDILCKLKGGIGKSVDFLNIVQYSIVKQCLRRICHEQKRKYKKSYYGSSNRID